MSSVDMNAKSVLTKEVERLAYEIDLLQKKLDECDDHTDSRLIQDHIWDLTQARAYLEGRVAELS